MGSRSESLKPFGIDLHNAQIKEQSEYIHQVISLFLRAPIPAQSIFELYLLKTFRESSTFVHEASDPDVEMQALYQYLVIRGDYIRVFLEVTNATLFQTNNTA